jgi:hypothetical protein
MLWNERKRKKMQWQAKTNKYSETEWTHNKSVLSVQPQKRKEKPTRHKNVKILFDFNEMQQMHHVKLCFGIFETIFICNTPRFNIGI